MEGGVVSAPTGITFRRIASGVYGTGIYRATRDDDYSEDVYGMPAGTPVELVISRIERASSREADWCIEEMLPNGTFTLWSDIMPSPTLRAAKAILIRDIRHYSDPPPEP